MNFCICKYIAKASGNNQDAYLIYGYNVGRAGLDLQACSLLSPVSLQYHLLAIDSEIIMCSVTFRF